jgi:membrane protein YdbS with pleckstrin-like domain
VKELFMFDLNLNKHFDSNEKLLLFFRPSRKAYLFQYFLIVLMFALIIFFLLAQASTTLQVLKVFDKTLALAVFIVAASLLIRVEYRIWSRRYCITSERVMYSRGIFYEKFHCAKYNSITDIGLSQSFWDKIVNTGTINLNTAGTDFYEIRYRKVSDPYKIKKLINDQIPSHDTSPLTTQPVAQPFPELNKPLEQKRLVVKKKK